MKLKPPVQHNMQSVSFRDVNEFLAYLPAKELAVVELLRQVIFNCIPDVREHLSYNVPYYKRHRNICLIWPASILWGSKKSYTGVRFGFCNGNLLQDEINYLDKGNRKQVYWKDFNSVQDIDVDLLKAYLFEAVEVDDQFKKK